MNNSCVCFTCKDARTALLKGRHSLLRYLGFIVAIFASAVIWIGMYLSGIICFYTKCGSRQPANKFGKSFYDIYLNTELSQYYPHMVSPILLHVFMWFCMLLTAVWLYVSLSLLVDYYKWNKAKRLRKSSKRWIIVTIIVCAVDLLLFLLFVVDFSKLKGGMLGASVRSMGDYDGINRPGVRFDDYSEDYDNYPSNRGTFVDSDKDPSKDLVAPGPLVTPGSKEPVLTFNERINLIKTKLANRHAELDAIIKDLIEKAAMIVETESGQYYNPMAQMRADELKQQLLEVEKLYLNPGKEWNKTETPTLENGDNSGADKESSDKAMSDKEKSSSADSGKLRRSIQINLEETAERQIIDYDAKEERSGRNFSKEMEVQRSKEDYAMNTRNFDRNTNSSSKSERKRLEEILPSNMKKISVGEIKDTNEFRIKKEDSNPAKNKFKFDRNSRRISAKEEYDIIWRSMFDEDDFGIILQNPGPGIGWRRAMGNEGTGGVDMVLAPSAVLMTLAIRGYIVWVFNLTAAMMVLYLYITRPRRPSLITSVQA